ncbi:hypothetical protein ACLI4U_02990 [Natrialbaceae archaeon A-CW2]|nr:hypothetical protein [Natronosalvus amylolyticus]
MSFSTVSTELSPVAWLIVVLATIIVLISVVGTVLITADFTFYQ